MNVSNKELLIAGIIFIILAGIFHWSHVLWIVGILCVFVAVYNNRKEHNDQANKGPEQF